jgi:hypothetical protein
MMRVDTKRTMERALAAIRASATHRVIAMLATIVR